MARTYAEYVNYMFWKAEQSKVPLSGTFELTSRCNLDCKMCYIHKRSNDRRTLQEERSAQEWIDMARAAKNAGMLFLLLTGGEPLLRQDFKEIYTKCHELGLLISINTNGTLITREIAAFFKENPPLRINMTIYGAEPETYENLCGDRGAYARVHQAIELLQEAQIPLKLNYSVTPQNIQDVDSIYEYAKLRNLPIQTATYMFPPVRARENCECEIERLTPKQAAQARWIYDQYRMPKEMLENHVKELLEGKEIQDSLEEYTKQPSEEMRCRAGATAFWITYHGQMRPCGMMTEPSVPVCSDSLKDSWRKIMEMRKQILLPAKCTVCKWKRVCEYCPAVCYGENGAYEQAPEYMCKKMDNYVHIIESWNESCG